MRTELRRFIYLTQEFTATVDSNIRENKIKSNSYSKVCCIINVKIKNTFVSDHCWISIDNLPKNVFKKGNKIKFKATVNHYYKNKNGEKVLDYCLSNIHNVKLISKRGNINE